MIKSETMPRDYDPEADMITAPGHRRADIDLYDADLHAMVGKIAGSVSRLHRRVTAQERAFRNINRNIKRLGAFGATIIVTLEALFQAYRSLRP